MAPRTFIIRIVYAPIYTELHHHRQLASSPTRTQRTPGVGADATATSLVPTNSNKHLLVVPNGSGGGGSGGSNCSNNSSASGSSLGVGSGSGSGGGGGGRVSEVMELCYVTERIIALWYREDARGVLEHATSLLRGKHAENYMIFNLSSAGRNVEPNTREAGWPQGLAPSLERLCALCKELDSWLNATSKRVVVLHARGGKERLGVAVSAYMNYSSICGGRDQELDRFAMRRFLDDKIGPLSVPSYRRYIEYFSGLLAGSLRISQSPLYLTHLTVLGVPLFEPMGCRAFLKVYEGLTPVYTSDLYSVTNAREFTVNLGGLRLRGDILVKCYHRIYTNQGREVVFSLQFHTCVITENVVSFPRSELDVACGDPRCPPDSVVTLYFANDPRRLDGPVPAPTPAVPHASAHHDPILHWDSYTNLELSDDEGRETPLSPPPVSSSSGQTTTPPGLGYTCGPLDGSLYAVVQPSGGLATSAAAAAAAAAASSVAGTNVTGSSSVHPGSGAIRSSPLTVSMDSGISSSAPHHRASPPELNDAESLQAHGDLDKLLHDMMMTVESIPDPPSDDLYSRPVRNGTTKMYMHDQPPTGRAYGTAHNGSSNYSTLKDSYRGYGSSSASPAKESSPPYGYGRNGGGSNSAYEDTVDFGHQRRFGSPERSSAKSQHHTDPNSSSFSPPGNIDYIDEDIPYHARQTSQPFSYGATNEMIKHQKLASPSLVRKASMRSAASAGNGSRAATPASMNSAAAPTPAASSVVADLDEILVEAGRTGGGGGGGGATRPASPLDAAAEGHPDPPPEFANGPSPTKPASGGNEAADGISWLKQQQLKLAARRDERSPARLWRQENGNRMIGELKSVQRSRLRHDGYASDSAVLDDDDDDKWIANSTHGQTNARSTLNTSAPASPLLPQRSASRKFNGSTLGGYHQHHQQQQQQQQQPRPRAESVNERPFVGVKRAYEFRKYNDSHSHNDSPSLWTERSVSPGSVQGVSSSSVSRPQTPAFPVHPRTPYNNSSPTVTFASDRPYQHQQLAHSHSNVNHSVVSYVNGNGVHHNASHHNGNVINNNHNHSGSSGSSINICNAETNNNHANYSADRAIFIEERREIRETGLPPKSPTTQRRLSFPDNGSANESHSKRWPLTKQSVSFDYSKDRPVSPLDDLISHNSYGRGSATPTQVEYGQNPKSAVSYTSINSGSHSSGHHQFYGSRRSSIHSNTEPQEVADVNVKFVRDTSKIWYKPNITREQAIAMLRTATPGTFVVRDSNSFPGAFGLALKVATPPPGAPSSPKDPSSELVRHFLIEPTSRGVRLKGCANEPVFSSLSALVYQHSLMAMALPCQLLLPEPEVMARALDCPANSSPQQLLAQGAACNVLYLFTLDTESLTGPQAIRKTITILFDQKPMPSATIVHFKVSTQGITLTDNARKLFFRRHYPTNNISYCGLDADERTWDFISAETGRALSEHRCFGFVARKPAHKSDNQCHIFAELEPEQPATAIVNFVNKVLMGSAHVKANIV